MRIFSNLAISLDGKIADRCHPSQSLGSKEDKRRMNLIRDMADVVVFGASTLRSHPVTVRYKTRKKALRPLVNAVISASGNLNSKWKFWDDDEVLRFVFTTEESEQRALENARDRAFVVTAGKSKINASLVLQRLKESALNNVLVEGGGETMSLFLKDKLLQELYVTLTPWILGGRHNPTLVDGEEGLLSWIKLKKMRSEWKKEELFLHYKVPGARRV